MITETSAVTFRQNLGEMLNQVQYRNDSIVVTGALPGDTRTLDLATISDARYESIERFDISGGVGVNNTLKFTFQDVKDLLDDEEDPDLVVFRVDGTIGDRVISEGQDWTFQGVNVGETTYYFYHIVEEGKTYELQLSQNLDQFIS